MKLSGKIIEIKYLVAVTRDTTLDGAKVLVNLFLLRVVLVVATERSIVGLTGTARASYFKCQSQQNFAWFLWFGQFYGH